MSPGIVTASAGTAGLAASAFLLLLAQWRTAAAAIGSANRGRYRGVAAVDLARGDAGRTIRIAILGDSLAAGIGAGSPDATPGGLIAAMVAERSRPAARVEVINRARSWSGARHLAGQAARLPAGPLDAAVIVTGANDALDPRAVLRSPGYLRDCVSALTARGTAVVCCTCPDLAAPPALPAPLRQIAGPASRMLARRQAAAVRQAGGVPVALHRTASPAFARDPGLLAGDRFHPNDRGYAQATPAVVDEIMTLLAARAGSPPSRIPAVLLPAPGKRGSWNRR